MYKTQNYSQKHKTYCFINLWGLRLINRNWKKGQNLTSIMAILVHFQWTSNKSTIFPWSQRHQTLIRWLNTAIDHSLCILTQCSDIYWKIFETILKRILKYLWERPRYTYKRFRTTLSREICFDLMIRTFYWYEIYTSKELVHLRKFITFIFDFLQKHANIIMRKFYSNKTFQRVFKKNEICIFHIKLCFSVLISL